MYCVEWRCKERREEEVRGDKGGRGGMIRIQKEREQARC